METLKITHNAGFFSCCSKRLEGIVWFFNTYKRLPDNVDSSAQFLFYKIHPSDDAVSLYFKEDGADIAYRKSVSFHNDMQFLSYQKLDTARLQPFIRKYFTPSEQVSSAALAYEKKYVIDYANTCAVYYRGNDKGIETEIAPYETFIAKAREIKAGHPNVVFLVQSDESEFMDAFLEEFPDSIHFDELPPMSKKNSFVAAELSPEEHVVHGVQFFGSIIVLSRCAFLVTHSGNGALWCVLYRGNTANVFQWLNGSWNSNRITLRSLWQANKKYVKGLVLSKKGEYFVQGGLLK